MIRIKTTIVVKIIFTSMLIGLMKNKAHSFPLPSPIVTAEHTQTLLPLASYLTNPACYPCWEALINVMQLSSAALFTADAVRIGSQLATNRTVTDIELKAGTVMSSIALAELALIQEILAAQGFRRWYNKAPLTPGARYYHPITTMGSSIGLWVICGGVSTGDFWTTAAGNVVVVVFFAAEAVTTSWRDPQLTSLEKWQIITGNIGGMLFAASSFVTFASQQAADAVLAAGLLVLSAALAPSSSVYLYMVGQKLKHSLLTRQ